MLELRVGRMIGRELPRASGGVPVRRFRIVGLRAAGLGAELAVLGVALLVAATDGAQARVKDQKAHQGRFHHRISIHGTNYHPPYAALVVDDNSGQVLFEDDPGGLRHPASLTKIMTLYLLFEQLEAGRLRLDTKLPVSAIAATQPPTKLGLKPGATLVIEDAIKGLVTRSANDAEIGRAHV